MNITSEQGPLWRPGSGRYGNQTREQLVGKYDPRPETKLDVIASTL